MNQNASNLPIMYKFLKRTKNLIGISCYERTIVYEYDYEFGLVQRDCHQVQLAIAPTFVTEFVSAFNCRSQVRVGTAHNITSSAKKNFLHLDAQWSLKTLSSTFHNHSRQIMVNGGQFSPQAYYN